jgi:hypothetical protein
MCRTGAFLVKQGASFRVLSFTKLTSTVDDRHQFLQMLPLPFNQYPRLESSFELSNAEDYFPQSNTLQESPISILTAITEIFKDFIYSSG